MHIMVTTELLDIAGLYAFSDNSSQHSVKMYESKGLKAYHGKNKQILSGGTTKMSCL